MIHVYLNYLTLKQIWKKTRSVFPARCNVRSPQRDDDVTYQRCVDSLPTVK